MHIGLHASERSLCRRGDLGVGEFTHIPEYDRGPSNLVHPPVRECEIAAHTRDHSHRTHSRTGEGKGCEVVGDRSHFI